MVLLALALAPVTPAPAAERAVELGVTPSLVYSLWSNINKAIMVYARVHSTDENLFKKLEAMKPRGFSDKLPADVMKLVMQFETKLHKLEDHEKGNVPNMLLDSDLPSLLSSDDDRITPSQVYLHSGQILVNVTGSILYASSTPVAISYFFEEQKFIKKTPSDVFGLVDLALRRLSEIAVRKKNTQSSERD